MKESLKNHGPVSDADSPEIPSKAWETAVIGKFFRPNKAPVSVRLDMDVLHWLKSKGPGYQTEINAILRRQMEAETK
jgi:uncharacterized protein (DUF4415 family)